MSRRRRPLAALALIAMVAMISACGSSAPAAHRQRRRRHPTATAHEKGVKFAECMRSNGVSEFPDPTASGKLTIDAVANGSSLDTSTPAFKQAISACKNLEPAGFTGSKRSSQQQDGGPQVRPVHPRQRRERLPGPHPKWAPRRHESNPIRRNEQWYEHSQRRDAEVPRCGSRSGGHAVRRKTWVLAAAAVLAAVAAAGGVAVTSGAKQASAAAQPAPANTAQVERRTLSAMVSQAGTLTYRARSDGSPYSVINQARGTYTKLPALGQVISQGHVLYRVNDRPVVLLHGSTPAYRTLSAGASGPDVAELNADLVALGYATRGSAAARSSASFGSATTTAVEKLQAALGVTQNGTLTLGQAVFEPTAVRVTSVSAQLGGSAQPGETVLQGTSTTRQVQVALDASQQTERGGRGQGEHHPAQQPDHPGCRLLGGGGRHLPVELGVGRVGIELRRAGNGHLLVSELGEQHADHHRGRHPVATRPRRARGIRPRCRSASPPPACLKRLVVPVTALLARSGGGYAVEVVGAGASNHLVPVSLGLFDDADGLVQVTGSGLAAGQEVVVPST